MTGEVSKVTNHTHDERLSGDDLVQHIIEQHPDSVTARDHDEDHEDES